MTIHTAFAIHVSETAASDQHVMSVAEASQLTSTELFQDVGTRTLCPGLIEIDGGPAPQAPTELDACDVDATVLRDLALKLANTVPHLTSEWAVRQLRLPLQLVDEIIWRLKSDRFIEFLDQSSAFNYRFSITQRGREHANRLLELSGYVGPAPVSLQSYKAMIEWQSANRSDISIDEVRNAIAELVLPEDTVQIAALAASSGRSLFLFGPPGNGKTSLGRLLHDTLTGELWIPHAIDVGSNIVRVFDPQCHQIIEDGADQPGGIDRRWVKIHRPLIVAGGEMTIDDLDLSYSSAHRFYEAPLHFKANGGTFLIDDFGRQRVDPEALLNRWIIPLEHEYDYLTLITGQKIQVPFQQMLIVATNLDVAAVADPAFLRRIGYRLHLREPNPEEYARIFQCYAAQCGVAVPTDIVPRLIARYQSEGRELRCCEPRDLLERVRDICRLRSQPFELSEEAFDLAWTGYFGNHGHVEAKRRPVLAEHVLTRDADANRVSV